MKINKLDYSLALVVAFFEAFALLFLIILGYGENSLLGRVIIGFLDGIFTGIIVLSLLKLMKSEIINKIKIFKLSLANGFFLAFMFFIEYFTNSLRINVLNTFILGFFVALLSGFVLIFVYNFLDKNISYNSVILIGVFEAFILPIMLFLLKFNIFNSFIDYFLSGFISGAIGSLLAISTYNFILSRFFVIRVKL